MNRNIKITLLVLVLFILLIIIGGSSFYKYSENISWLDAFYSTILFLVTVGFVNFTPEKPASKIFTIFLAIVGIPAILFCLGYIVEEFIKSRMQQIEQKINKVVDGENKILSEEGQILQEEKDILEKEV